jgi:hypothetical protein
VQGIFLLSSLVCVAIGLFPRIVITLAAINSTSASSLLAYGAFAAAAGLSTYGILQTLDIDSYEAVPLHLLLGVLIIGSAFTSVEIWKFVAPLTMMTWSEQMVYISALQTDYVSDLYSTSNLLQPPFRITMYPPLYYAVQKLIFVLADHSLLVGRYISAGAVIAIAACLWVMPVVSTRRWKLVPPLMFLCMFPTLAWRSGSFAKPEFLATCLSVAGFTIYLQRGVAGTKRWVGATAVLCGAALLAKQSAFICPWALSVHLMWDRRYRELIRFICFVTVIILAGCALVWASGGDGLWLMTFRGNAARLVLSKILTLGIREYLANAFVIAAVAASGILLVSVRGSRDVGTAAAVYFLSGLAWFVISVGRPGSSYSYFLDGAIGACLVLPLLLYRYSLLGNWTAQIFAFLVVTLAVMVQLPTHVQLTVMTSGDARDESEIMKSLAGLRSRPGEYVLADPLYVWDVIKSGRTPLVTNSYQYTLMNDNGLLSVKPLLDLLQGRKVPYLVLQNDLEWHATLAYGDRYWPQSVVQYLRRNYTCQRLFDRDFDPSYHFIVCQLAS